MCSPQRFLFSRLNNLTFLNLSSKQKCSRPLNIFCSSPLDMLQHIHVFQSWTSNWGWCLTIEEQSDHDHPPWPAGHTSFCVAQDMAVFLGCQCTFPGHAKLFAYLYLQVFLHRATLNPFVPWPVSILVCDLTQLQYLASDFVGLHEVCMTNITGVFFQHIFCECLHEETFNSIHVAFSVF